MPAQLEAPESYRHPDQPTFICDITRSWEYNVAAGPNWMGGYPPIPTELDYEFLGQTLGSDIVIAAGPSAGRKYSKFYFDMGFGIVIEKTKRTTSVLAHPAPNIAILDPTEAMTDDDIDNNRAYMASNEPENYWKSFSGTNSYGNPSSSPLFWVPQIRQQRQDAHPGQALYVSVTSTLLPEILLDSPQYRRIFGNASDGYPGVLFSDLMVAAALAVIGGADGVEGNLACPNVTDNPFEGQMYQAGDLVYAFGTGYKTRNRGTPLGMKFGRFRSKEEMKRIFAMQGDLFGYYDYYSGVNAISAPVVDRNGNEILPGRPTSGVCGKVGLEIGLRHTEWAAQIRAEEGLDYKLCMGLGVTGVKDIDSYKNAGADVVQIGLLALTNPLIAYEYRLYKAGLFHPN